MGQKVNANIFRIGYKNNEWDSKYIENNFEELSLYVYQDFEIKSYINRFFRQHKLLINLCKIQRSEESLNIYISYYITLKSLNLIHNINASQKIIVKKKNINKNINKKRSWIIYLLKKKLYNRNFSHNTNTFAEKLLESLTLFTNKTLNINIVLQNLNKGLSLRFKDFQLKSFSKTIIKLRKYFKALFFRECINILSIAIKKKNSSKLLAEFLSFQFSVMKRHNLFLNFFKRALILMINSKFSCINGIKILIKGRLNGKPRSSSKTLQIGKVSLQTLDSKINHSQSVAFSQYGTFGIKVWICEK
jgi:hypothetical protein